MSVSSIRMVGKFVLILEKSITSSFVLLLLIFMSFSIWTYTQYSHIKEVVREERKLRRRDRRIKRQAVR